MKTNDHKDDFGILTDVTKCTGCEKCVEACKAYNQTREGRPMMEDVARRWKARVDDLSITRYTTILPLDNNRYVRKQCRHCLDPACVSACLVGALQKDERGMVFDNFDKCIGCRYCMMACPFGVPRYDWAARVPFQRKCNMCFERVRDGGQPACTEICPEGATVFGKREELIAEAQRRIDAEPDKYLDKIYGVDDVGGEAAVGGTSVIYITYKDTPLDNVLGWKRTDKMTRRDLPNLTWQSLKIVPHKVIVTGAAMGGLFWVIDRRMKNQRAAAEEAAAQEEQAAPEAPEDAAQPDDKTDE